MAAPRGGAIAANAATQIAPVVNWHLEPRCNYKCKFCFATFEDVKSLAAPLPGLDALLGVPAALAAAGVVKLTFVGGEPMLHPHIFELVAAAKRAGLCTSMVTNGSRLDAASLLRLRPALDQLAFSVDASDDALHVALGRAVGGRTPGHLAHVRSLWGPARELGFSLKINTVVTKINLADDMSPLIMDLLPDRWKVFQALPVEGQNDGAVDGLLVTDGEFGAYVARHRAALAAAAAAAAASGAPRTKPSAPPAAAGAGAGVEWAGPGAEAGRARRASAPPPLVAEGNDEMRGTYAMLDAFCRRGGGVGQGLWRSFYSNTDGPHAYGPSILDAGAPAAWAAVRDRWSAAGFVQRGGVYDYGQGEAAARELRARWAGAGAAAEAAAGGGAGGGCQQ
ncbi:hypothetical protein Rsub_10128 [Raphidocelis subcapitata]|uniref:Radical SAM core domain-containing protein n=1 Tax=Raphidocelis subcapitata TaxID=307507 RepID=A0A2V0PII9_9CHLO|nr:hypothetical protein Rsub_10128 [Raphidocelis subcapitata]|eukprot:GBF97117.1 hypothetical protein Rsub_10128 [Raphidocelis subcapitata]